MSVHTTSRNLIVRNKLTVLIGRRVFSSDTVVMSTSVTYSMSVHHVNFLSLREISRSGSTFGDESDTSV